MLHLCHFCCSLFRFPCDLLIQHTPVWWDPHATREERPHRQGALTGCSTDPGDPDGGSLKEDKKNKEWRGHAGNLAGQESRRKITLTYRGKKKKKKVFRMWVGIEAFALPQ